MRPAPVRHGLTPCLPAACRNFTLGQLDQCLGYPVALLGSHPQWGRELWQPIQTAVTKAQLSVHTFVGERESITLDGLKRRWTRLGVDSG
ncbi:MAG: hypothetical protein KFB97_14560 [Cyanobium sp. M30B3]|nr:MAG: hypothetical protein KFB97_14560 [Cyanobium sp. M30B3]